MPRASSSDPGRASWAFGAAAAQRVRTTPWSSLGLGLATLLAVPMGAMLLLLTLLGIPLALAGHDMAGVQA